MRPPFLSRGGAKMLGIPLRYLLKRPVAALADMAADPLEVCIGAYDAYVAEREQRLPRQPYQIDSDWELRLHEALAARWPCAVGSEFWDLWRQVMAELEAKGIRPGPESFQWWND